MSCVNLLYKLPFKKVIKYTQLQKYYSIKSFHEKRLHIKDSYKIVQYLGSKFVGAKIFIKYYKNWEINRHATSTYKNGKITKSIFHNLRLSV